jgi:hypothetical protein
MPVQAQKIEWWVHWLLAKPVTWVLFVGWLIVGFVAASIFYGGRAIVRHYWPAPKRA